MIMSADHDMIQKWYKCLFWLLKPIKNLKPIPNLHLFLIFDSFLLYNSIVRNRLCKPEFLIWAVSGKLVQALKIGTVLEHQPFNKQCFYWAT